MIYLDNHATTQCDPKVVETMLPYFSEIFGNPSSTLHEVGRAAGDAVKHARNQVARLIGAKPKEIIFTSGATESNNIAIHGLAMGSNCPRKKIVTIPIEHKAILNQCNVLKKKGWDIIFLPVDNTGTVDLKEAKKLIKPDVLLVSIQMASNEIGTLQPIKELVEISHENGAYFHTDAAQAAGKIPVNVDQLGVDLLSISAHKMYGPKGIGALYIRDGAYSLPIRPIVYGGEQEFNLRSGTLNVPGIVGFGKASELCQENINDEMKRLVGLRDELEKKLLVALDIQINGALNNRLPNSSSLTFNSIDDSEAIIVNMPQLCLSTGSACTSGAIGPSYVLQAIGLSREDSDRTIRISIGRFNTKNEVNLAADIIIRTVNRMINIK